MGACHVTVNKTERVVVDGGFNANANINANANLSANANVNANANAGFTGSGVATFETRIEPPTMNIEVNTYGNASNYNYNF